MSERLPIVEGQKKQNNKLSVAARAARLLAIGSIVVGGTAVANNSESPNLVNRVIGNEKIAEGQESPKYIAMTEGETKTMTVTKWGEASENSDDVRTLEGLREKAGWSRGEQEDFDTALGILNGSAYNEAGELMPGNYKVPVNSENLE